MGQQHTEKSTEAAKEPRTAKDARERAKPTGPVEQDGTTPHEGRRRVPAEELNPDDFE